jgi:hypothetical protein
MQPYVRTRGTYAGMVLGVERARPKLGQHPQRGCGWTIEVQCRSSRVVLAFLTAARGGPIAELELVLVTDAAPRLARASGPRLKG